MPDEHAELQERLAEAGEEIDLGFNRQQLPKKSREENEPLKDWAKVNACQWAIAANDTFYACGGTKDKLPSGVYRLLVTNTGLLFSKAPLLTDKLIDLKDTASKEVIEGIKTFWAREHEFKKRGIIYKRGVLLWGNPGAGKTVAIAMLMKELVDKHNGIVLLCDSPAVAVAGLHQLRRIEPTRRLIVVLEDIDEILREHGEHNLLALLDGENQINGVVFLATSNFPENLGARIVNRPSRFDEVRKIGMPNQQAREIYLQAVAGDEIGADLPKWVADTEDMSIAHLRELVVAVFCMQQPYDTVIERLKKMHIQPKPNKEFGIGGSGAGFTLPMRIKWN